MKRLGRGPTTRSNFYDKGVGQGRATSSEGSEGGLGSIGPLNVLKQQKYETISGNQDIMEEPQRRKIRTPKSYRPAPAQLRSPRDPEKQK